MEDKSKLTAIILSLLAIIVVIVSLVTKNINDKDAHNDILIVTNASNFYTVNSCLYRTVTYITSKDIKSLMLLLNDDYKEKNGINEDNVLDVFPDINATSTFVSEKMYYSELSDDITKYYVHGYIEENQIYDDETLVDMNHNSVYFVVYLNTEENIFSIEPYDGKIFVEGDLNE